MVKRITSKDVAELAGVSRTTVSFVLNGIAGVRISEETRRRVLQAAAQLHYYPDSTARRMVAGYTNVIGFIVRQTTDQIFADRFLTLVLAGVSDACKMYGFHTLFEVAAPDSQREIYTHLLGERFADGLIVFGSIAHNEDLHRVHEDGAPVVLIGQLPNVDISYVDIDNIQGAKAATQHLIQCGCRRIAMIANGPAVYPYSAARVEGYRHALEENGLAFDETLVRYADLTSDTGNLAMQELLALPTLPDAVFVASDTVAFGAMQAIRKQGLRIPEDIAVVGFDDLPIARYAEPPLTTIQVPAYQIGWRAVELVIRLIRGQEGIRSASMILETELVVRQSSGGARVVENENNDHVGKLEGGQSWLHDPSPST